MGLQFILRSSAHWVYDRLEDYYVTIKIVLLTESDNCLPELKIKYREDFIVLANQVHREHSCELHAETLPRHGRCEFCGFKQSHDLIDTVHRSCEKACKRKSEKLQNGFLS